MWYVDYRKSQACCVEMPGFSSRPGAIRNLMQMQILSWGSDEKLSEPRHVNGASD